MEKAPNFAIDPLLKALHLGDRINDRFEIVSKPVRRSHSFAFKVSDLKTGISKVLLFVPTPVRQDAEAFKIVKEHFQLVRILDHPNIAKFFELHAEGKFAFMEMEYVPGNSLKTIKAKKSPPTFSEEEVKWIAGQILDGLEYAHNQNILHKDLKPANIVLTPERKIKLIDFGISEPIRQALTLVQDTTATTSILYWSPEQVSGKRLSIRSDIYSLGATLYDLLSGNPPFLTGDVYNCILYKTPEPIPAVSPQMNDLLFKALAKNPDERFQTCAEMRQALQTTGFPQLRSKIKSQPQKQESKPQTRKKFSSGASVLKPNLRYPLVSALLIVLIAVFIAKFKISKTPKTQPAADSLKTARQMPPAPLDSFQVKMINALLSQAQEQIQKGHLVQPKGNNALTLLNQALKIDSTNQGLLSMKKALRERILEKIRRKQQTGHPQQAVAMATAALQFYPDDPDFSKLLKNPQSPANTKRFVRIEILNGAGQKGIAKQLKQYLEKQGFTVVNTENYRINGKINWNVKKSKGSAAALPPDSLKILNTLTEIPIKPVANFTGQSSKATVTIILGKDFRKLKPFKRK